MRSSRLAVGLVTLALGGAAAVCALPAGAAPNGGGCLMAGTAKFVHGPNTTAHSFTYTFAGKLTSCQASPSSPASGSIATLAPAKGSGTCGENATSGVALVTWADRSTTIVSYTTQSAAAEVLLQGKVLPAYKVGRKSFKTTRDKGASALGNLVFDASPQQCAGKGVTSAAIQGFTGLGSS
jgi:hypothetical protein